MPRQWDAVPTTWAEGEIAMNTGSYCTKYALSLIVTVVFPLAAAAQEIHGTFTGSGFPTMVDTNNDGITASNNEFTGVASVLGRFSSRSFGEYLPFTGEFCSDTEVKLFQGVDTAVYTAANGDTFYAVLADSPASEICFNFVDNTSGRTTVHLQIQGGTGRFEGASGHLAVRSNASIIHQLNGAELGFEVHGNIDGEIILAQ
jgi:hypothetical protein